jgi:acyl-CoA reductase-like NAD-dependent aldehyde dehydrogenase
MATSGERFAVGERRWRMLVAGNLVEAVDGATYPTSDPATGRLLAEVPSAGPVDVERAVAAAAVGGAQWRLTPPRDRANMLRRLAASIRAHADELGTLDALDSGNPLTAMTGDVEMAAQLIEMYADWVGELGGRTYPGDEDHLHYSILEPYGVVARIVPYNHPVMFAASRLAAPLLAGNAVVLKAADQTPLSALRIGELAADLVPPGVVTVLTGTGAVVGRALVEHPSVRRVAFTGSVATGRAIMQQAAGAGIKHVTLELGGKNPMLVLADADVEEAADGAVRGMNFHWTAGQSCGSTSRLLVDRRLVDAVTEAVVERARSVRMGDPLDRATEMGCLVSAAHRDRVMGFIERGQGEGLCLATGGARAKGGEFASGSFVEPTVFAGVPATSSLARDEIFGPVLVVIPFETEVEAVEMANASNLGLTASIWTKDLGRAHRLARAVEAGYVWINTASRHFAGLPFGGMKDSGLGREEADEEVRSFTQTKAVSAYLGPSL